METPVEFSESTESAWIDVIQKMDKVYADLVHYQVELEQKNAELEEAQQFIRSVLESMTEVLVVCDVQG
ncbi:MAG: PAS domain-containing sensor histidine kinase, partial [Candidatus Thiodiazotropha taylori]|nr:PAS domain-containing sensor histidine kinase [Candidatus Thiodiazotropha taylori]